MVHGVLVVGIEVLFGGDQLEYFDPAQIEAVRGRDGVKLGLGFGQGDIESLFPRHLPGDQELQRQGRLAGAGRPVQQIDALSGQPAAQHRVEFRYTGIDKGRCLIRFAHLVPPEVFVAKLDGRFRFIFKREIVMDVQSM